MSVRKCLLGYCCSQTIRKSRFLMAFPLAMVNLFKRKSGQIFSSWLHLRVNVHSAEVASVHLLKSHLSWCCELSLPQRLWMPQPWGGLRPEVSRALAPAVPALPSALLGHCCLPLLLGLCQHTLLSCLCCWDSISGLGHIV